MCGIVYAQDLQGKPVNNDIMQVFDKQRHRGTEGFGLFDGQEMNMVHATKENKILKWLVKYDSNLVMFHHRNPSSTINVKKASHPFSTRDFFGDTQYVLVHNGHIYNSYELADDHYENYGIEYQSALDNGTFNDSESLLWELALVLEGHKDGIETEGAVAFICLKIVKGKLERMYFGRNTSPLRMVRNEKRFELHSEGEGEMIDANVLYNYNYAKKRLSSRTFQIPEFASRVKDSRWDNEGEPTGKSWNPHADHQVQQSIVPYQSNDEWDDEAGNWLPNHLRRKVQELRRKGKYNIEDNPNFIDYDADGEPIYVDDLPKKEYKSFDDYFTQRKNREMQLSLLSEDKQEEAETLTVDESEGYTLAFEYLIQAQGNFENAYFFAENDYSMMFDTPEAEQDEEFLKQVRVMEVVLQAINSDPEYVNEHSVSSTFAELSRQGELINA